jgi:alpha-glucosidase
VQDQYLYGADMLVAPVWQAGQGARTVVLPSGAEWEHLWTGTRHVGGQTLTVEAPVGQPAVFFRPDSRFAELFRGTRAI